MNPIFPIVLVTADDKKSEQFVKEYCRKNNISEIRTTRVTPAKNELSIDEVRLLKKDLLYAATMPTLIHFTKFETATIEAQNALLKTLEEQKNNVHFILSVSRLEKIVGTLLSRSKIVVLKEDKKEESSMTPYITRLMSNLKKTKSLSFLGDSQLTGVDQTQASEIISAFLVYFQGAICEELKTAPDILKKIIQVQHLLENNNLNPQLTLDYLLIYIARRYSMNM